MKTIFLRFALVAAVLGAFVKFGVTPSRAADAASSSSSSGGMGGCCGKQAEEEKPKNCPSGSTWDATRAVCLEPNGTPRAPLN